LGESATAVAAPVATLAQGTLHAMAVTKLKTVGAPVVVLCALAAGASWAAHGVLAVNPGGPSKAERPQPGATDGGAPKLAAAGPVRQDYYGDPLPPGVLARLGTVQLRHRLARVVFSPDGKSLVSAGTDQVVRFWDTATGRQARQTPLHHPRAGAKLSG